MSSGMARFTMKKILSLLISAVILTIFATAAILFAEQYILKDGRLVQTGMIDIHEIKGAKVYKNGEEAGDSPGLLTYLEEGDYKIRLEKKDREHWERTIAVTPGNVVSLYPLMLPEDKSASRKAAVYRVIPTSASDVYLTVEDQSDAIVLNKYVIEEHLFNITISKTTLANLSKLGTYSISSRFEFICSPYAERVLIKDTITQKIYLAGNENQDPEDISDWFSFDTQNIVWTRDEDFALISSSNMLVSINMKTGQRVIIHNAGNEEYTSFSTLKRTVVFSVDGEKDKLYKADLDGDNLQVIKAPDAGWGQITGTYAIEEQGILIVDTQDKIWKITPDKQEPELLADEKNVAHVDQENQIVLTYNTNEETQGTLYLFDPSSAYDLIDLTLPKNCSEIGRFLIINRGQNIIYQTLEGIHISTEDGKNLLLIAEVKDTPVLLLGAVFYRGEFVLRYASIEEGQGTIYEFRFDN